MGVKVNKKIEAQLDLRGNSTDNSVNFREFSAKLEFFKYLKFKIGNTKKPFGYQYLMQREELIAVSRSLIVVRISELGYGGRSVSIMGYYKYSKKRPELPISYYISLFRNNSLFAGIVSRFVYHFNDDLSLGGNYLFQQKGGEDKILTHGFGIDFAVDKKRYNTIFEIFYVQDPIEGVIRKLQGKDEVVFSTGAALTTAYNFKIDAEIIKGLEPLIMLSYFVPDIDATENHVVQSLLGLNIYCHKDVRFRINGDLRLTKNQYNDDYSTKESRGILEFQVRF
jgi:hypothetical protein